MRIAVAIFVGMFVFVACGGDSEGSEAFCDATREVINLGEVEEVPPEVQTMVDEAPDEIKGSAETVADAFNEAFDNQDLSVLETEEFQEAATELREYAVDNCSGVTDESS